MESQEIVSQKIFEEQNTRLADLEAELAKSTATCDTQNTRLANLEAELAKEKEDHLATMQINEALQAHIDELENAGKNPVAKVVKVPDTSFKVGEVDYVFTVPALHYKSKKITAEQALNNKDLLQFLVEEKSSLVKRKNA